MFEVVVRNSWEVHPQNSDMLIHDPNGDPVILATVFTEAEAQAMVRKLNDLIPPGRLNRLSSYQAARVNVPFKGYTNWYTWTVAHQLLTTKSQYEELDDWLAVLTHPVNPEQFRQFVLWLFNEVGPACLISKHEMIYVNWLELAAVYEDLRLSAPTSTED